jgi:hypothetical protein
MVIVAREILHSIADERNSYRGPIVTANRERIIGLVCHY